MINNCPNKDKNFAKVNMNFKLNYLNLASRDRYSKNHYRKMENVMFKYREEHLK